MGLEDIANKAKEMLHSDKAEEISDNLLEKAGNAVSEATGGKFDAQIDQAQGVADSKIGNE